MHKRIIPVFVGALILILVGLAAVLAHRPVTIRAGAQGWIVDTRALSVGWALRDAGLALSEQDVVSPGLEERLPWQDAVITITRPRPVSLWQGGQLVKTWWSAETTASALLSAAGVTLAEADQMLWNGAALSKDQLLPDDR